MNFVVGDSWTLYFESICRIRVSVHTVALNYSSSYLAEVLGKPSPLSTLESRSQSNSRIPITVFNGRCQVHLARVSKEPRHPG